MNIGLGVELWLRFWGVVVGVLMCAGGGCVGCVFVGSDWLGVCIVGVTGISACATHGFGSVNLFARKRVCCHDLCNLRRHLIGCHDLCNFRRFVIG